MSKPGVMLCNLGSPASPSVEDVGEYLEEFLSDPRVLDLPTPLRQAIVKLFIVPFRKESSAESYETVWQEDGAPLIQRTYRQAELLQERINEPVDIAMRYQEPSVKRGLRKMNDRGVDELFVIPLYPHYAMSSYETAVAKVQDDLKELPFDMDITFQPPFYDDPDYIDALYSQAKPYLDEGFDHIIFSYHGTPRRHLTKRDPSGCYCLQTDDCCKKTHPVHSICYQHQVYKTTWDFAQKAGIPEDKYTVTFQSRVSPDTDPWLTPYTDETIEKLARGSVDDLLIMSPAFVSDCLETTEELGIEGKEEFLEAGGESFYLIPCLNDSSDWIDVLEKFVDNFRTDQYRENNVANSTEKRAAQ